MTRDSDTHPKGGDASAAPFMGSAGRQASLKHGAVPTASADAVGDVARPWLPITDAPTDGTRVQVGHHLDLSSTTDSKLFQTTGAFIEGRWICTAGFICTDGMFRFAPTLWRHLLSQTTQDDDHG